MTAHSTTVNHLIRLVGRAAAMVLDPTIVASYDRTGYCIHALGFDSTDLDVPMHGKVCLVTGANSGIGLATSRGLAQRGATVWMLCRDPGRGRAAVAAIRHDTSNDDVHLGLLDVSKLDAIHRFVEMFEPSKIDVLIHNAGVLPAQREVTPDGLELTLATNLVGPLLLTHLLLPHMHTRTVLKPGGDQVGEKSRIIIVSSGGMYTQRLDVRDMQWVGRKFDGVRAYAQTKRAQVILSEQLAQKLEPVGVSVHAMHPGWSDTPSVRVSLPRFYRLMRKRLRSPEQGADTVLWLAVAEKPLESTGLFWFDRQQRRTHVLPWTRESESDRERLWRLCCQWAGIESDAL